MLDITVHMLTQGGEFTDLCIEAVKPYVKDVLVVYDQTPEIHNDLIGTRNSMIQSTSTPWIWIVDDDELWPPEEIEKIKLGDANGYAFQSWAIWNKGMAHGSTSKTWIPRIFKRDRFAWVGKFGRELPTRNGILVFGDRISDIRYIHLTHVKKQLWRKERDQLRKANDRRLVELPESVKKFLYDKGLSSVRWHGLQK